jgi:hypothetical protein
MNDITQVHSVAHSKRMHCHKRLSAVGKSTRVEFHLTHCVGNHWFGWGWRYRNVAFCYLNKCFFSHDTAEGALLGALSVRSCCIGRQRSSMPYRWICLNGRQAVPYFPCTWTSSICVSSFRTWMFGVRLIFPRELQPRQDLFNLPLDEKKPLFQGYPNHFLKYT